MSQKLHLDIRIRPANPRDAKAVTTVHVDSWRETYRGIVDDSYLNSLNYADREVRWRQPLTERREVRHIFVAAANGTVIGFANVGDLREPENDITGELYELYLLQDYQKLGVGKRLFETGVRKLMQLGHNNMLIWALSENPACSFYKSRGGRFLREQRIVIGNQELLESAFIWENLSSLQMEKQGEDMAE